MNIQTRYRDIPNSELREVHSMLEAVGAAEWERKRGKPIEIESGPINFKNSCGQPWYRVAAHSVIDGGIHVCPHIAVIGD